MRMEVDNMWREDDTTQADAISVGTGRRKGSDQPDVAVIVLSKEVSDGENMQMSYVMDMEDAYRVALTLGRIAQSFYEAHG